MEGPFALMVLLGSGLLLAGTLLLVALCRVAARADRRLSVMSVIARAEAERQTAAELGFQEAQREEAELIANGFYDKKRGNTPSA
ncbi:MAG: hypothetical protein M3380_03275 [Chloroflexota bacterium]|nr:hypothetical protein [Chloroflexota bacterium]